MTGGPERRQHRTLSDADVDAIVEKIEEVAVARFYSNLGRGAWGVIRKLLVMALLGLAAYGAATGKWKELL